MGPSAEPEQAPEEWFERLYQRSADPWHYETSEYERAKYERTLGALPERTGRTLELACSIGVFTEMLAPRCTGLLAVDFSPTAVARTRARLAGAPHVEVTRRTLPEEMPDGPFDAIVCSELLYYWSEDLIRDGVRRMEDALAPGGTLVAVDWRGPDPDQAQRRGDDIHDLLRREVGLRWRGGERAAEYRLDSWCAE